MTIKNRLDAAEKYLKQRNPSVGIILPSADGAELYFDGTKRTFPSEGEAKSAFYRQAGPNATLIIW